MSTREAARRIAMREHTRRRITTQIRQAVKAGRRILFGKTVEIMKFDAANPGSQSDSQALLEKVAKLLGVDDPTDSDALSGALDSLMEAANGDDSGDPESTKTESPKEVSKQAIARGRARLGWTK